MPLLDVPVIDAHVHLWNPDRFKMNWLEGDDLLNRSYELEEFTEASREVGVEALVFVEAGVESQYAFLENRVLFGSDWPVVLLASKYNRWVQTLDRLTSSLSQEARRKLWAENARRCYRL